MRAVVCHTLSGPEGLEIEQLPSPDCPDDRIRIHVWASGLNYVDALFVQGLYQLKPALPFIPGSEVAGEITEVGSAVSGWQVGDRVFASIGLGGFAGEVVVNPAQLIRIPDRLSYGQAATMTQSYATAWFALTRRTMIQPDEWMTVLGAAGGVGLAMIDVGRALGAKVIAAASTDEKLQLCIERGAHGIIKYSDEDLKTRIRELTDGGADVVVDPIGGENSEKALRGLTDNGRFLVVGFASGAIPNLPANQILLRNRNVIGVDWGSWAMSQPDLNAALLSDVVSAVDNGVLTPIEPVEYPLNDVSIALRDLLERKLSGKACLTY
ncbi:MAG TPA: NADPH:quinone oxidoreductase family protein [Microthrixaceae bacterium]|nr:NADPH:quinone oxidoreductase family protein [Microthrixaceae bacterium]